MMLAKVRRSELKKRLDESSTTRRRGDEEARYTTYATLGSESFLEIQVSSGVQLAVADRAHRTRLIEAEDKEKCIFNDGEIWFCCSVLFLAGLLVYTKGRNQDDMTVPAYRFTDPKTPITTSLYCLHWFRYPRYLVSKA